MQWEQKTNWYLESDREYRISKTTSKCPGQYTAWAPGSKPETPALGYAATLEQAKQLCETHFNNRSNT